jgi:hypothetical protein
MSETELCYHENYETKKVMDFVFNVCLDCGHQWRFGEDPKYTIVSKKEAA